MKQKTVKYFKGEKSMTIEMELSRILICELNQHQVVFLREKNGQREFPIIIGLFEATMIDRKMRRLPATRPYTHDLLCEAIYALGGVPHDIHIDRVDGQTYYAQVRIMQGEKLVILDARPSDALVLAITVEPHLAVYVADDVLKQALKYELP